MMSSIEVLSSMNTVSTRYLDLGEVRQLKAKKRQTIIPKPISKDL